MDRRRFLELSAGALAAAVAVPAWLPGPAPPKPVGLELGVVGDLEVKSLGASVQITRQHLLPAYGITSEIEAQIRQELTNALALEIDRAMISGAAGGEPETWKETR